jgi:hypothetical protein
MATLPVPEGLTLTTLLSEYPDEPLPNIAGFDVLAGQGSRKQIADLMDWIEPQQVCNVVLKHHGADGLRRVLMGIAKAASKQRIPMRGRVQSVAEYYDLEVF